MIFEILIVQHNEHLNLLFQYKISFNILYLSYKWLGYLKEVTADDIDDDINYKLDASHSSYKILSKTNIFTYSKIHISIE
jgi:hypothetical protein